MDERTRALLQRYTQLVSHPLTSDGIKAEAIIAAYEIGVAEGRCEGAHDMGDELLKTLRAAPPPIVRPVNPKGDSL